MDNLSYKVEFNYKFLTEKDLFSTAKEIDIPLILRVEADFKIFINEELYFEEPISILEFYYVLYKWKISNTGKRIRNFIYYSIDYDESVYEEGAVISLLLENETAQVKTIFEKASVNTTFELRYAVEQFMILEDDLRRDLSEYFNYDVIDLLEKASYIQ